MERVKIWKPSADEVLQAKAWPIWEKEASTFDWYYSENETFYVLQGKVEVTLEDGSTVEFGAGDMVQFLAGTRCIWKVKEDIRKHFNFG